MNPEPEIAFAATPEPTPLEIRVNFGVFTGRAATPAEIDDLARALLPQIAEVSIVAEERHEISEGVEASLHQVRVEITEENLPATPEARAELESTLVAEAGRWAQACADERHIEIEI